MGVCLLGEVPTPCPVNRQARVKTLPSLAVGKKTPYMGHIFEDLAGCENLDDTSQNLTSRYVNETVVADRVTTIKAKKCWMLVVCKQVVCI